MKLTSIQEKEVEEVLSLFGFLEKDRNVYVALLELGPSTLTPLSKKTSLPLSTVQSVAGRLVEKGVVGVTKRKSRAVYEALDPSVFKELLKEQATALAGIVPLLKELRTKSRTEARVRVFERERVAEILNESLKAKNKQVYEIVSAGPFQQLIGEKYHYTQRRVREGIALKSLRVRSTEIKKYNTNIHKQELREARFLPAELTFHASLLFWDETVAIFSTKQEGAHVLITSKSVYELYEQLFNLLWSVSAKMETLTER